MPVLEYAKLTTHTSQLACLNPCVRGCPKVGWLYLACVGACEVTCGAIANPGEVIDLDGLRALGVDVDA
jgi:hypothetical protein